MKELKTQPSNWQIQAGYSDEQLESLSHLNSIFDSGISPWATWESENSSFGKTFRKWANFPSYLPLFFASDHAVHWESRCWPNEISSKYNTYLTWNRKKNALMRHLNNKNSYYVPHPWIHYRKKYYPRLPKVRIGTIVFFAHSNDISTPSYEYLDSYIDELKALPEIYQPVVICLSFHDINKGLHKDLRKYSIPLVTAGTTNSQQFVDRFYSLVYQFKYSSSANIGSHTFYLIEAGIPFFLLGSEPVYSIKGSEALADGKLNLADYGDAEDLANLARLKELLSVRSCEITEEQSAIVSKYLGTDSDMTRYKACWIFWREFFMHFTDMINMHTGKVSRVMKKWVRT